ncbi:MAG: type II toxin-antitoxin system RelE/ParE family toxin [Deltaproteobacteria bacterium]|nr:type II toxin-antitoxin system RelE/ParE family toxin [Deltaproteobacteria bacterium]
MLFEIGPKTLDSYVDGRGKKPFWEWLDYLKDLRGRFQIKARLDRLEAGNLGDYRPVGNKVFELKIDFGPGYRVYFSFVGDQILLLLCGGGKDSQDRDIEKAKEYLADYWKQHGDQKRN